jgi:hypothetical protein
MSASVGDRIRLHSNSVDAPDRTGTVVAVLGQDGGPPYRVRFDAGEETIVTPGPDATIEPPTLSERVDQVRETTQEKVGEATAAASEKAAQARDAAREKTEQAREAAEETAGNAREAAQEAVEEAREGAGKAARAVAQAADKIAKRFER